MNIGYETLVRPTPCFQQLNGTSVAFAVKTIIYMSSVPGFFGRSEPIRIANFQITDVISARPLYTRSPPR